MKIPRRDVFERSGERVSVFDRIGKRASVFDRIGKRGSIFDRIGKRASVFDRIDFSNIDAMTLYDILPMQKPESRHIPRGPIRQGPIRKPEFGPKQKLWDMDYLKPEDIIEAKRIHVNKVVEASTAVAEPLTVKLKPPTEVAEPVKLKPQTEVAEPLTVKPPTEVAEPLTVKPLAEVLKPLAEVLKPPAVKPSTEVVKPPAVKQPTEVLKSPAVKPPTEVVKPHAVKQPTEPTVKPCAEMSKPPIEVAIPAEMSKSLTEVAKPAEVSKPPTEESKPTEMAIPSTEGPLSNLDEEKVPKEHKLPNSGEGDYRCNDLHYTGSGLSLLNKLKRHNAAITGVCLPSSSSDKLYSVSKDGTLCIWDGKSGECVESLQSEREIGCLVSEGPWLFVGLDNCVEAWNFNTSTLVVLDGPNSHVRSIAVGDGDKIICGLDDGSIMVWKFTLESKHPALVATLKGHQLPVSSLCIVDGFLYSASADKSIRVWDLKTFECRYVLNGHSNAVTSIFFWGRTYMLSGSLDNTLKVWAQSEDGIWRVIHQVGTGSGVVGLSCIGDAATSTTLLCSLNDNSVRLYSLPSFTERGRILSGAAITTLVGGSSNLFFTGNSTGQLGVWWCEGAEKL